MAGWSRGARTTCREYGARTATSAAGRPAASTRETMRATSEASSGLLRPPLWPWLTSASEPLLTKHRGRPPGQAKPSGGWEVGPSASQATSES